MLDYKVSAQQIIQRVGGNENINKVIHCSTRLRFTLNNFDKVDLDGLKEVEGVLGAITAAGQCQVIIGNNVIEMFDAVHKELGNSTERSGSSSVKSKMSTGAVLLDFLIGVFQPLVPAIAGGGMLKSMLLLFSALGWMSTTSTLYTVLNVIGSAPLTFLPVLVAYTTATKLNVNPLVATSAVSALLLPEMTALLTKGFSIFGLHVTNISYASQVFPAILCVLLYAVLERVLNKYTPKPIRIFFVPMVALAITVPITLLFLGPAGYVFGEGITTVIFFLYNHFGWVATATLAALLPLMVSMGMHKAFVPYAVAQTATSAGEPLYLAASLGHNLSESGVCFAIALRTKDKKLRATAISSGISALFGITEPALYGVTLQHKRALTSVMVGGAIGGGFVGFVGLKAFVAVGPGVASLTAFADPHNSMNLIWAIVGTALTFIVSFIIGFFAWKENSAIVETTNATKTHKIGAVKLALPIKGAVEQLADVNDNVFSSGILGDGIAVIPDEGKLYAPIAGEIEMVYETNHALGMKTASGVEILFHIGIDTVQLKGKGFTPYVQPGDKVKKGDLLMEFDLDTITSAGYDPTVMMIITDPNEQDIQLPVALV